jgi:putative transposase
MVADEKERLAQCDRECIREAIADVERRGRQPRRVGPRRQCLPRAPCRAHTGQVQRAASNERWSSDGLQTACWNGEYVQIGFVRDCHDRECMAWVAVPRDLCAADIQQRMHQAVAHRFGASHQPAVPIQWLSDNGSICKALDTLATAERLHLEPITTPVASPESNGMAEAFVNTLKRDYGSGADRGSAAALLEQVSTWIADYNAVAPHSALGFRSPMQYRSEVLDVVPAGA